QNESRGSQLYVICDLWVDAGRAETFYCHFIVPSCCRKKGLCWDYTLRRGPFHPSLGEPSKGSGLRGGRFDLNNLALLESSRPDSLRQVHLPRVGLVRARADVRLDVLPNTE